MVSAFGWSYKSQQGQAGEQGGGHGGGLPPAQEIQHFAGLKKKKRYIYIFLYVRIPWFPRPQSPISNIHGVL